MTGVYDRFFPHNLKWFFISDLVEKEKWKCIELTFWNTITRFESIPTEALFTIASRRMIDNVAQRVISANTRTWILAFCIDTGSVHRTFAVHRALRSTRYIGISKIILNTSA